LFQSGLETGFAGVDFSRMRVSQCRSARAALLLLQDAAKPFGGAFLHPMADQAEEAAAACVFSQTY
jgi:hypothetical protein